VVRTNPHNDAKMRTDTTIDVDTCTLSLAPYPEAIAEPGVREAWIRMLDGVDRLNRLYASPEWAEHLTQTDSNSMVLVCIARDPSRNVVGLCVTRQHPITLPFDIASRSLGSMRFRGADVLGSECMVSESALDRRRFLDGVLKLLAPCDCLYLDSLPVNSATWDALCGTGNRDSATSFVYDTPERPWHAIDLGGSFDEYLKAMSGKSRGAIRRKVRDLREHAKGSLTLTRIEHSGQVPSFLDRAVRVSEQSWQRRVLGERVATSDRETQRLGDLAKRRLLRSYLLEANEAPCAFVIGLQAHGVFHYGEPAFDETMAELSPGTVLLYLLLEDLFAHQPPTAVNFGIGDGAYKRRFGNRESRDTSVYLFRRTLTNGMVVAGHAAFRSAGRFAKRLIGRRVTK
jgi:CelD/BcsL family acetyltransferase involved in cellulose biosynthesis